MNNVSITFEKGALNIILGLNGAGKTTLFDLMTGAYPINNGRILNMPNQTDIIYLTQSGFMSFLLEGKDYIRLVFKVSGFPFIDDIKKMEELMNFENERESELFRELWKKRIGQMSVGERRWLYVTTLSQLDKKVYIFDEPTTGIDPSSRIKIYRRLERLTTKENTTVILSTHHLHELEEITCKLIVLSKGKIQYEGSYSQFLKTYNTSNPDVAFDICVNDQKALA